ncbi:hypothetical protein DIPPA_52193 [Diplonema papillatum]|nr:hypothetical protein DIPPA_52193 [Diplonema papillatum]
MNMEGQPCSEEGCFGSLIFLGVLMCDTCGCAVADSGEQFDVEEDGGPQQRSTLPFYYDRVAAERRRSQKMASYTEDAVRSSLNSVLERISQMATLLHMTTNQVKSARDYVHSAFKKNDTLRSFLDANLKEKKRDMLAASLLLLSASQLNVGIDAVTMSHLTKSCSPKEVAELSQCLNMSAGEEHYSADWHKECQKWLSSTITSTRFPFNVVLGTPYTRITKRDDVLHRLQAGAQDAPDVNPEVDESKLDDIRRKALWILEAAVVTTPGLWVSKAELVASVCLAAFTVDPVWTHHALHRRLIVSIAESCAATSMASAYAVASLRNSLLVIASQCSRLAFCIARTNFESCGHIDHTVNNLPGLLRRYRVVLAVRQQRKTTAAESAEPHAKKRKVQASAEPNIEPVASEFDFDGEAVS